MRCDGEPIGVEISFECKGQLFGHVISHNLAFEKQGVGIVLAEYAIRTAHRRGLANYDLLPPADAYKMKWADACIAINDWALPLSRAGRLYVLLWLGYGRHWVKQTVNGAPQ